MLQILSHYLLSSELLACAIGMIFIAARTIRQITRWAMDPWRFLVKETKVCTCGALPQSFVIFSRLLYLFKSNPFFARFLSVGLNTLSRNAREYLHVQSADAMHLNTVLPLPSSCSET